MPRSKRSRRDALSDFFCVRSLGRVTSSRSTAKDKGRNISMRIRLTSIVAAAALLLTSSLHAQVPQLISYQGRVSVAGVNFNGTGSFSFALVDPTGTVSY